MKRSDEQPQEELEKLQDLEDLVLARRRMQAVEWGEDQLVPLEELMREFGIHTPDDRPS